MNTPALNLAGRPRRITERFYPSAKRVLDVVVALLVLGLSWPLMLLAAAAIRIESPGPAIFRQKRCTRGGRLFVMLKLRTMHCDASDHQARLRQANEVDGPMFKMRSDPRVTRVGVFLRRMYLDELPQLFNVLRGQMSLVGPRPLTHEEMTLAPVWRRTRLKVLPGMTGLWQVRGSRSLAFADWIHYDIEYVGRQSLLLDLRILGETIIVVIAAVRECFGHPRTGHRTVQHRQPGPGLRPPSAGSAGCGHGQRRPQRARPPGSARSGGRPGRESGSGQRR